MKIQDLLKKSGYSKKAIEYYLNKVNVGEMKDCDAYSIFTGICGDTMEFFLKIESSIIKDAKFQVIGCAGASASGSALCEMVKGKTLDEAKRINEKDILDHLGSLPEPKIHCACLATKTLHKAIENYIKNK